MSAWVGLRFSQPPGSSPRSIQNCHRCSPVCGEVARVQNAKEAVLQLTSKGMYQQEAVTAADVEPYCQQPRCFEQYSDSSCKPPGFVEYVQPRVWNNRLAYGDPFAGIAEAVAHNNFRSLSDEVKASTSSIRDDMRAPENIPVFVMLPLDTVSRLAVEQAVLVQGGPS